jgi:hypothetical protein
MRGCKLPVSHGGFCKRILTRLNALLRAQAAKDGVGIISPARHTFHQHIVLLK